MIARDEEALLPGCLASVKGVVDQIVLADTGSVDGTREVARAAGALVVEEPWQGDFAAARNAALRCATGDWILVLDADERLAPGAGQRLRAALKGARFDLGMLPLHNADRLDAAPLDVVSGRRRIGPPVQLPRLLRHAGGLAWKGIVHESVEEWIVRRGGRAALVDADIVHLGAVPELRAARGKRERNLELLRRRCEADPGDAAAHGYLAGELSELGRLDEAAEAADRGWAAFDAQPASRSLHRLAVVRAIVALRRGDPGLALASLDRVEARQGPHPDLAWLRGCALDLEGGRADPARAPAACRAAAAAFLAADRLRAGPRPERLTEGCQPPAALVRAGEALLDAAAPAEALAAFRAAAALAPASRAARLGEAEALLALGRAGEALAGLEPVLGPDADGWALAAAAAAALGAAEEARLFSARARDAGALSARRSGRLGERAQA
jgi:tetratricopeptide (TPR) repeat protein